MTQRLFIQKMKTRKRGASNNSLRNKKESTGRPGVYKERKQKVKMYLPTKPINPQTHTPSLLRCAGADPVKPTTALRGR